MRELVDEDQRRVAFLRRVEIEFAHRTPVKAHIGQRQHLEALQQHLGFLAPVGLDDADDDVPALVAQRARRGEHCVGLADAG